MFCLADAMEVEEEEAEAPPEKEEEDEGSQQVDILFGIGLGPFFS